MAQHPVPPVLLEQIGDVVVSFAMLENSLRLLAGSLVGQEQRIGQIITSDLSFKAVRALVASLYLQWHGKDTDYAQLRTLLLRCRKIEERRNGIVHALWGAGPHRNTITRLKVTAKESRGFHLASETLGVEQLRLDAGAIKQLVEDLTRFMLHLVESRKARF